MSNMVSQTSQKAAKVPFLPDWPNLLKSTGQFGFSLVIKAARSLVDESLEPEIGCAFNIYTHLRPVMTISYQKDVLTTGEVARICHVAPRTVSKWVDTGRLRGYRIPGSRDRRIPRRQLEAFMRANGIPLDGLDAGSCRILVVGKTSPAGLVDEVNKTNRYEAMAAENDFEAGILAQQLRPHVIVVYIDDTDDETAAAFADVKKHSSLSASRLIAAVDNVGADTAANLARLGFDECIAGRCTLDELLTAVEKLTNIIS